MADAADGGDCCRDLVLVDVRVVVVAVEAAGAAVGVGRARFDELRLGCSAGELVVLDDADLEVCEKRLDGVGCASDSRLRLPMASLPPAGRLADDFIGQERFGNSSCN